MVITVRILVLLLITLIICAIGFKKYIWFISIGYGLSISGISIGLIAMFNKDLTIWSLIYCIIMTAYGFRLGGFLAYREIKTSYNSKMKGEISDGSGMNFGVKIALWITCALLYIMMMAPIIYRCSNGVADNITVIIGLGISVLGIILESTADAQKNAAKKKDPGKFCSKGLFRIVRCPNYLGELIIWTGLFVSAFGALAGVWQWVIAAVGYVGIIYIMFSGARRLEIRQDKNYGELPEYQEYKNKTPIILPLIPLYSVKKHKWLVG